MKDAAGDMDVDLAPGADDDDLGAWLVSLDEHLSVNDSDFYAQVAHYTVDGNQESELDRLFYIAGKLNAGRDLAALAVQGAWTPIARAWIRLTATVSTAAMPLRSGQVAAMRPTSARRWTMRSRLRSPGIKG